MVQVQFSHIYVNHLNWYSLLYLVLFLFQTVEHVNCQTLIYNTQFTSQDDWMLFQDLNLLNGVQVVECLGKKIFYGTSNEVIFKTFFLRPHFAFQIMFIIFYSCSTDFSITIFVDNQSIDQSYPISVQQSCSAISLGVTQQSFFHINQHYSQTLQVQIIQNSDTNTQFWGITDFTLSIFQCPQQCDSCNENGECDKWTQLSNYFGEDNIPQIEGWQRNNQPFGNILSCGNFQFYGPFFDSSVIQFNQSISKVHSEIRIRFKFIAIQLEESQLVLKVKINNQEQTYSNNPMLIDRDLICGNFQKIIVIDGIFPHNYSKILSIITLTDANPYSAIRDFEIFADVQKIQTELCNDQNIYAFDGCFNLQFDCSEGCSSCVKGQCMECYSNWQYDHQNYNCLPICGDNIIVGFEECDDSNQIPYDGCHQCQFSCPLNCIQCNFGTCIICNHSFQLVNNICIPYCIYLFNNGNQQQLVECQPTNHNCQLECLECENKQCIKCQLGWNLFNFECVPELCYDDDCQFDTAPEFPLSQEVCGDGIIQDLEECDDANTIPFDGCFECQFQCQAECTDCQFGVCQMCEISGWQLQRNLINLMISNKYCIPLYGDEFIVEEFEGSDEENDQNNNNVSSTLLLSFYVNLRCGENQSLVDFLCVNLCGNGLLSNQHEECDDGNHYGGDGCSSFCYIEDQYQCLNEQGSLSQCTYIQAPDFNMNILLEKANSNQVVELTFTQEVKLKEQLALENFIHFQIIPQTQYKLTIKNISIIMTNLSQPKYQIQIEFIEPIQNPILQVNVERDIIYNQFEIALQSNQQTFNIGTPFVLQQTTKEQLASVSQLNDAMMYYSMASVSGLALVTGNSIMFFNLLDLLQSLSYLRFMSYQFPPHLYAFLNTYTKVSLQPILNYFQIDQLLEKLNHGQKQNQVDGKSRQDTQNILTQLYLFNAKSCYFSVFASMLTYLTCCLLVSNSLNNIVFYFTCKYKNNLKILKLINIFQIKIQRNCLILKIEYFSFGIQKVFQATLHQMIFSLMIQFPNYPFSSTIEIFSSINAFFGLLYILRAIYPLFSITSSQIKNQNKWKYFYFESKTTFWAGQFKSISIFRILFYIIIIVKLINYPEAQSILLSMQSTFFVIYLIKFKPLKSKFELSKIICRELLFLFITGSFLLYSFQISQDNLITIGWIHISMFCTMLASNLFIDLFEQILKLYDSYLQKKQKVKMMEENKHYLNRLQGYSNQNDQYLKQ